MQTVTLKIKGMSCGHCKMAVTRELQGLGGVSSVEINLDGGTAKVTYDPGQASLDALKTAVSEAGYEVVGTA